MPFEVGSVLSVISGQGVEDKVRVNRAQRLNMPRTTIQALTPAGGTSVTSVASGAASTIVKQDILNPPKSEIVELDGVGVLGGWNRNCPVNVLQPASVYQFGTSQSPTSGTISWDDSPWECPLLLSMFVVYERQPALLFTNNSPVSISPEFRLTGTRYELARFTPEQWKDHLDKGRAVTAITIGGFSS